MPRRNGHSDRSPSRQQAHKKPGGSKQSRQRNHTQYRQSGIGFTSNKSAGQPSPHERELLFTVAREAEDPGLRRIVYAQGGEFKPWALTHEILNKKQYEAVSRKLGSAAAKTECEAFIAEHAEEIPYFAERVYSFLGKGDRYVLGISPVPEARDALNADFVDLEMRLGTDTLFRHRQLIIGTFAGRTTCLNAVGELNAMLAERNGLLTTFSGAIIR